MRQQVSYTHTMLQQAIKNTLANQLPSVLIALIAAYNQTVTFDLLFVTDKSNIISKKLRKVLKTLGIKYNEPIGTIKNGRTALIEAASCGYTSVVYLLAKNGASLDITDINGNSPLCHAVKEGHTATAVVLMELGADISLANLNGETALCIARKNNNGNSNANKIVAILQGALFPNIISKALTPSIREQGIHKIITDYAYTATFYSLITSDSLSVYAAQLLVIMQRCELGYSDHIDASDSAGLTPLHWASLLGHKEAAKALIENHAHINSLSNKNDTPLDWAIHNYRYPVAELLRENGGVENSLVKAFIKEHFKSRTKARHSFWYNRDPDSITLNDILQHAKSGDNINGKIHTGDNTRQRLERLLGIKINDVTTVIELRDAIINRPNCVAEPRSCRVM